MQTHWRIGPDSGKIPTHMATLHLTNGDSVAAALGQSGIPGDRLAWRDLLHDGPVPPDADLAAFHRARGEFLASRGWATQSSVIAEFAARDARIASTTADDEVVLWFEPDLYDQLQLIQVLARFAGRPTGDRPALSIVPADCYLGPLAPDKFRPLFDARRPVGSDDLAHAEAAWTAFTGSDPASLLQVTEQLDRDARARAYAYDDVVRLPHLAAALRRQLEEYPDTEAGLSRTERQLCEILAVATMPLGKLFTTSQNAESWQWLGDWSFAWYVQRLSDCPYPLIQHPNGSRVIAPLRDTDGRSFWERPVELTPFGQDVIRDRADLVRANGIDRWIGGVHCSTRRHWRWDPHRCTLTLQG